MKQNKQKKTEEKIKKRIYLRYKMVKFGWYVLKSVLMETLFTEPRITIRKLTKLNIKLPFTN